MFRQLVVNHDGFRSKVPQNDQGIKGIREGRGVLLSEDGVDAGEDPGSPFRIRNLRVVEELRTGANEMF